MNKQKTKELARSLRKDQTEAENVFWHAVRNRQFAGKKFLRQYRLRCREDGNTWCFIADFYCAEHKLVVELDGSVHDQQKEYDTARDKVIASKGLTVIRFTNEEVIDTLDAVLESILDYIND